MVNETEMGQLPRELPADVLEILGRGNVDGQVQGWAVKAATQEIARRYLVSQIEALRAVHYHLGGVPPDSRLHEQPPDEVYCAERPTLQRSYRIEVDRAPAGSRFTDGYRLVEINTITGARRNTFPNDLNSAMEQAEALYGLHADDWTLVTSQG